MTGRPGLSARTGHIPVPVFLPTLLLFLLLFIPTLALSQSIDLPLSHWGYPLLDRLEAKGLFHLPGYDARPLTRQQIADALRQIDRQADRLTPVERALVEELKGEFTEELAGTGLSIPAGEVEPHLLLTRGRPGSLVLDSAVDQRAEVIRGDVRRTVTRTTAGLAGRVRLAGIAALSGEVRVRLIRGAGPVDNVVDRPRGILTSLDERNTSTVDALGSLAVQYKWLQGQVSKNRVRWGPGLRSFLNISDQAPPYPLLKLTATFRRFKLSYFHGFLIHDGRQYIPGHPLTLPSRRYFVGHRLDFQAGARLRLAFQETIVYGNRGVEPPYLTPVLVYYFTEPRVGHDDKRGIMFDATITPRRTLRLYGQFLITDWSIESAHLFFRPFSYHADRWGIVAGAWLLDPAGLRDTDLRVEYTRIEPYVYTQRKPWNVYQYQRRHLGGFLQPNSDNLYVEGRYRPNRALALSAAWQHTRHANREDGDIYGIEDPPPSRQTKHFLGGVVERTTSLGFSARYEPLRRQFLSLQYTYIRAGNVDFVAQTTGRTTTDHRLLLSASLEY